MQINYEISHGDARINLAGLEALWLAFVKSDYIELRHRDGSVEKIKVEGFEVEDGSPVLFICTE